MSSPLVVADSELNAGDDSSTLPQQSAFKVAPAAHSTYRPFTAFCFTVNYILGVGVLGMPHGFVSAGWFLSLIVLSLITLFSWITGMWIVQVQDRAKRALLHTHTPIPSREPFTPSTIDRAHQEIANHETDGFAQPLIDEDSSENTQHVGAINNAAAANSVVPDLLSRRLEVNELIGLFCGSRIQRCYEICLSILIVGALWAYAAVFAGSMAVHVQWDFLLKSGETCTDESQLNGSCQNLYFFYIAIFAAIVVPLTCRELTELKLVMIALALFRFVSLGLMMLTAVVAIYEYPSQELAQWAKQHNDNFVASNSAPYYSNMRAVIWNGLGLIFPIAVSSQLFHHSIPNLSFPLRPKKKVPQVFSAVLMTTFALYASLGICVGLYYGTSVPSTCTLIWVYYTGRPDSDVDDRAWIATAISYIIVLFPPIDVLSAFPLNAITFGNNLLAACVSPIKATQRKYIIPFRLIAAITPLVGAMIVKDLGVILQYTGCVGVAIAFIFPALLSFYSKRYERVEIARGHLSALDSSGLDVITGKFARGLDHSLTLLSVSVFAITGLIASIALAIINAT